jgi:hypothetical protein
MEMESTTVEIRISNYHNKAWIVRRQIKDGKFRAGAQLGWEVWLTPASRARIYKRLPIMTIFQQYTAYSIS